LHLYFCSSSTGRPFVFIGLLLWLAFLFSTLGISASDFFCPNLATISALFGLDENVAGVTFLALGNGSPDVFATFSAMRADSGSLAIGELLGAASFIVSVVVGSMCIIKPFKVNKGPFLRDVGFFTTAVTALIVILSDGSIHLWESLLLIALYIFYVLTVIVSTWWETRSERKRRLNAQIRGEYADDIPPEIVGFEEPYRDERTHLLCVLRILTDILQHKLVLLRRTCLYLLSFHGPNQLHGQHRQALVYRLAILAETRFLVLDLDLKLELALLRPLNYLHSPSSARSNSVRSCHHYKIKHQRRH
jgi:Ca2+/Na+ antiporter